MQLRASTKFIKLGYVLSLMLALAIAVYLGASGAKDTRLWWLLIVPAVLDIVVVVRHVERRLMKLEIFGDRVAAPRTAT